MATVTVNVQANTSDATQDINKLDGALNQAEQSADDLSNSLERQEARIKTLGGAINIVGGSVEVLAGGLALSGALTEEQAEQFEGAALGAIAFADGAKRVFEGYKELSEGIRAYGGAAKIAQAVQARLNTTILANPYVAAAAAVAAVTVAVIALIRAQDDEEAQLERIAEARERYNKQLLIEETNRLRLVKAQGANAVTLAEEELKAAENLLKATQDKFVAAQRENQFSEETKDLRLELTKLEGDLEVAKQNVTNATNAQAEADKKAAIEARNLRLEREGQIQVLEQLTEEVINSLNILGDGITLDETLEEINEEIEDIIFFTEDQLKAFNEATAINEDQSFNARRARIVAYYDDLIKQAESNSALVLQLEQAKNKTLTKFDKENLDERSKLQKAFASKEASAIQTQLDAASQLTEALVQVVDDGTKEGFEASKKYKIAEVITSSTQAAFQAFAAAQQFGPILGPILGAAQVGAITVAANRAIQDIRSSTFEGDSITGGAPGGVSSPSIGFGQTDLGGGSTAFSSAPQGFGRTAPIRAYVVTGDVRDGIEAETLLQTRRQFP